MSTLRIPTDEIIEDQLGRFRRSCARYKATVNKNDLPWVTVKTKEGKVIFVCLFGVPGGKFGVSPVVRAGTSPALLTHSEFSVRYLRGNPQWSRQVDHPDTLAVAGLIWVSQFLQTVDGVADMDWKNLTTVRRNALLAAQTNGLISMTVDSVVSLTALGEGLLAHHGIQCGEELIATKVNTSSTGRSTFKGCRARVYVHRRETKFSAWRDLILGEFYSSWGSIEKYVEAHPTSAMAEKHREKILLPWIVFAHE